MNGDRKERKEREERSGKCLCKYFPEPCTNCPDLNFGEKEESRCHYFGEKQEAMVMAEMLAECQLCHFNIENQYPQTSFGNDPEEPFEDPEETLVYEKFDKEKFDKQILIEHSILHDRAMDAMRNNNVEMLKECLQAGLNANNDIGGTESWTYLHHAVSSRVASRHDMMKLLIDAGAYVNSIDYDGDTPLFLMSHGVETLDFVGSKILIDAGADPNFCNYEGDTPLSVCISLIERAPKKLKLTKKKPLMLEIISMFLENGGDLTIMLDLAQSGCCDSVVYRLFLKAGADPYLKCDEGYNMLYYLEQCECKCAQWVKSIKLFKNATSLSLKKTDRELPNCTTCSICYSGNRINFCQTQCCRQHLHIDCLNKWLDSSSNMAKSCPFCRQLVKEVNLVTIQPVFNPVNVSKKSSDNGLIFSYLFETEINEIGQIMYKLN